MVAIPSPIKHPEAFPAADPPARPSRKCGAAPPTRGKTGATSEPQLQASWLGARGELRTTMKKRSQHDRQTQAESRE